MLPTRKKRINVCKERISLLVQSVINSKKVIDINTMEKYLESSYSEGIIEDCAKKFGLEISKAVPFVIWPVFLGTEADNINICSVNFGALTLFEKEIDKRNDQNILEYINAAVNVLVVTNIKKVQDGQVYRYWPTSIDYSNKTEQGTINQASLSLTSLFKFGFLDKNTLLSNKPLDNNIRYKRFEFFAENLNWILKLQNSVGNSCAAWPYAENCKDIETGSSITTAIVPSQFCYELVSRLYNYFLSCEENKRIINKIAPGLLSEMSLSCNLYENWIANTQKADGGYGRNNNSLESSFAHSCCAMLTYVYNDKKNNEKADYTRLNNLISYLVKNYKNFNFDVADISDNYTFLYGANNQKSFVNDIYEIFPETLFLINCCKNIDDDKNALVKWYYKRSLRVINYKSYEKLFSRLESIQINNTYNNLVVRGRQQLSHKYPIYILYYTKICLQRLKTNDETPLRDRKKYISLPIFINLKSLILFLLLAVCVITSYIINPSDTLTTLILSIATFIFPTLIHFFYNKDSKR